MIIFLYGSIIEFNSIWSTENSIALQENYWFLYFDYWFYRQCQQKILNNKILIKFFIAVKVLDYDEI